MFFRIIVFATGILLAGVSAAAFAQSSATMIAPQNVAEGDTPPAPKILDILDTDYPLESLLANEEGKVSLNLVIGADGRVTFAQVLAGSGSPRLDQTAAQVANARWQFQPALKNANPAVGSARVDVTWKTPLRPAYEFQIDESLLPRDGNFSFDAAASAGDRAMTATDYPRLAIVRQQQGKVSLKIVISETGEVSDSTVVQTSGFPLLDDGATKLVRARYRYRPATLNGMPIQSFMYVNVDFQLVDVGTRPVPRRTCSLQPTLGGSLTMSPQGAGGDGSIEVSQWIHVAADGTVDDVLVFTQRGWMHLSPDVVAQYSKSANYPPASRQRRPPSCWVDGTVAVGAK